MTMSLHISMRLYKIHKSENLNRMGTFFHFVHYYYYFFFLLLKLLHAYILEIN